jgi:hypothetical protein
MALIEADSTVPDATLREMLQEHVEGIRSFSEMLAHPPQAVTDPARIDLARSFAGHVLRCLEADSRHDRAGLRDRVNLSYEVMLILIDYAKTYTAASKVPRGRAAST